MKWTIMLTILALILGAEGYVLWRLWQWLPALGWARALLLLFAVVAVSGPFLALFANQWLPEWLTSFLYRMGSSWLIALVYLVLLFLVIDLVRLTHLFPGLWPALKHSWWSFGSLALGMTLLLSYGYVNYLNKKRVELDPISGAGLERPLKIVALSDLHLGYATGAGELARWVGLINAERPDLVLLLGDVVDNNTKPMFDQRMEELFRRIEAPLGVYGVLGNHEYIADPEKSVAFYEAAGIRLLRDSVVSLGGVTLVGRDDRSNRDRRPLARLIDSTDRSPVVILLDHQPSHLEEAERCGVTLQLSGHTHQGQVWPLSWVASRMFEDVHGPLQKGGTRYFVSSGMGIWGGKFRIGTRSEYLVFEVR